MSDHEDFQFLDSLFYVLKMLFCGVGAAFCYGRRHV